MNEWSRDTQDSTERGKVPTVCKASVALHFRTSSYLASEGCLRGLANGLQYALVRQRKHTVRDPNQLARPSASCATMRHRMVPDFAHLARSPHEHVAPRERHESGIEHAVADIVSRIGRLFASSQCAAASRTAKSSDLGLGQREPEVLDFDCVRVSDT